MHLWRLVGSNTAAASILCGISDDLPGIMRMAEAHLKRGDAFLCRIVEAVPRMTVLGLETEYVPTGREWLGRRNTRGGIRWDEKRVPVDPSTAYCAPPMQDGRSSYRSERPRSRAQR
jgi:hypothetical protein